ncbi:unnamed protein product [Aphis gossypii]|uniref:Inhibitor of growth protein N-terminal histone-binding domain-containing protein n=1 Tax=Aphis gossypii TaxID=80765 RepID=A0A9P0NM78_APHGO|nr:unnamed protein product [Aphis gossypii]
MASSSYTKHCLDSLENLPVELQQNLTLMQNIDSIAQQQMHNIDKLVTDFVLNGKVLSGNKKKITLINIQRQFEKAKKYSDDKVLLAKQTCELVDKNIKGVDSILEKLEDEIYERVLNTSKNVPNKTTEKKQLIKGVVKPSSKSGWLPDIRKTLSLVSVDSNPTNPTNIVASGKVEADSLVSELGCAGVAYSNEQLQIPVYPNELTYCLCKEVSYGKMIACDNPECPSEVSF